jgi:hypothetical protein
MMTKLPLQKTLIEIEAGIKNERMIKNFRRCLQSFGYQSIEDDLLQFFSLIIDEPDTFKNKKNYPATWHADNSFVAGLISISKALDCKIVRDNIDPGRHAAMKDAVQNFIQELKQSNQSVPEHVEATVSTHRQSHQHVQVIKESAEPPVATKPQPQAVAESNHASSAVVAIDEQAEGDSDHDGFGDTTNEYLLRLVSESHNLLEERKQYMDELKMENQALKKQIQEQSKCLSSQDSARALLELQHKLSICMDYITNSSETRDAPLVKAFTALMKLSHHS